jgi:glycosyltransferase involved in cell wall biosynthesis
MSSPRVSVALCTRNGARFLGEQLDSLAVQSLPPAEIVACDDASEDATRGILEEFARQTVIPVQIHANPAALGVARNFERAIGLCSGDIIALADQDDVWHADKLARLTAALSAPRVQAVFSDAEVVDADLAPLGYGMWKRVRFTAGEQRRLAQGDGFAVLLKHRIVTGATLAFKSSLRGAALPIPEGWPHDAWLALIAASQDGLAAIDAPLVDYRQHGSNAIGGTRKSFLTEANDALCIDRAAWYREELVLWRALAARLQTQFAPAAAREMLAEKLSHLERRADLPAARWQRIPGVLRELSSGGYARFARNWGSVAIDLLVR